MADAFDLIAALDALASRRPDVINMSFSGPPNAALQLAIERTQHMGPVIIAAIGEEASDPPPLKWSSLMYGFSPELEDHDADEETQAGRDRREAAAG